MAWSTGPSVCHVTQHHSHARDPGELSARVEGTGSGDGKEMAELEVGWSSCSPRKIVGLQIEELGTRVII